MPTPAIRTESLTKHYGETIGVQELDLQVDQGEVFGFLGPNGAGKTTTIRLLLDLIRPTAGRAFLLGLDCQEHPVPVRSQVGFLPGELALWEDRTGREHIEHIAKLRGDGATEEAYRVAERLEAQLDKPAGELSSGNKQKIGLALAFLPRPEILILDEPTGGLDPLMQREVLALVDEVRQEGRTVFFSSHILQEVERVADRVGIIRNGHLAAVEDVDQLIHGSVRIVELTFSEPVDASTFEGLENVENVEQDGARLRLTVAGSIDRVVKTAAQHAVLDLQAREPDLEEVFLRFYGGEAGGA